MVQRIIFVCLALLINLITPSTHASDVLFEGYYKILSADQHIGYVINQYKFDPKKKQFQSTYLIKTGKGNLETTESLKAFADEKLNPLSYEYTSLNSKESKLIDMKFKGLQMTGTIKQGNKISRIDQKIQKGTFLSTFLVYLMLKSPEGLKTDTNYSYEAVAEEEGKVVKGQALVGKEQDYNSTKALKVLNTFNDIKFLSFVNDRGEIVATNSLGQGIATELVSDSKEAIGDFSVNSSLLKTLFGAVPLGKENVLSKKRTSPPATVPNNTTPSAPPEKRDPPSTN